MRVYSILVQCFFLLLLSISLDLCDADDKAFKVVGKAECADCSKNNLNTKQAFSGLRVTIDCNLKNGDMKRIGAAKLNELGQFSISLPLEIVHENGQKLKQNCYAQLHNAAALPCPTVNSREASKIVFNSQRHAFAPANNLHFSVTLCTSKFFWPFFNPNHPWFKYYCPPVYTPPVYNPPVVMPQPPPEAEPLPPPTTPPQVEPLPPQPSVLPPPVNEPPIQPLPPPVNEPPIQPLPPPVNEPPIEPLPPTVYTPPKKPCPPIFTHPHP